MLLIQQGKNYQIELDSKEPPYAIYGRFIDYGEVATVPYIIVEATHGEDMGSKIWIPERLVQRIIEL